MANLSASLSISGPASLFTEIRAASAFDILNGRSRAESQADWVDRCLRAHAELQPADRRAITRRFPPSRYVTGQRRVVRRMRVQPATLSALDSANAIDRDAYPDDELARHQRNDFALTALRAAVARAAKAAGGELPPVTKFPRALRANASEDRVLTVAASADLHETFRAASASWPSFGAWVTSALQVWVGLDVEVRRSAVESMGSACGGGAVVRRVVRVPASVHARVVRIGVSESDVLVDGLRYACLR